MKFGLTEEQYKFILDNAVKPLVGLGAEIWCYGSRARGDHRPYSDLDIMVESDQDLSLQISKIEEHLSNSNFPFKVDLVQLRNFAESYRDGYLRDRIRFSF